MADRLTARGPTHKFTVRLVGARRYRVVVSGLGASLDAEVEASDEAEALLLVSQCLRSFSSWGSFRWDGAVLTGEARARWPWGAP